MPGNLPGSFVKRTHKANRNTRLCVDAQAGIFSIT